MIAISKGIPRLRGKQAYIVAVRVLDERQGVIGDLIDELDALVV